MEKTNNEYPILKFIFKHKKINLIFFSLSVIISLILVFFVFKKEYTSEVSIIPSAAAFTSGLASKLGGLGNLVGLDIGSQSGQSQEMYMGIIKSKRLLDKVMFNNYHFTFEGDSINGNLINLLEIDGKNKLDTLEQTLKTLREDVIYMEIDDDNNILYLSVTTPYPQLSADLANLIVVNLNDIVKNQIQKEFRQQYQYLTEKIKSTEDSVEITENDLRHFLEKNTDPTIPKFIIEQIRLKRKLEVNTQIYIELKKQLEVFTVENMINLSDVKILDKAFPPYKKSRPKRVLLLLSFVIIAFFLQFGVNASVLIYPNFKEIFEAK